MDDLCGAPRLKIKEQADTAIPYNLDLDLGELDRAHNKSGWEGVIDKELNVFSVDDASPGQRPVGVNEEVYDLVQWHQYREIQNE